MKKWIDIRSFALGGVMVLSTMYILGAAPRPGSPGPVRRFAIVVSDASSGDAYVLDTITGQVWPRYVHGRTDTFYAPKLEMQTVEEPNEARP